MVVEAVRSSLDIKETKEEIISVIGKYLKADRCFIMEYDKQNDRFKETTEEYASSPNIKSYLGVDLNFHIPHFIKEFKNGKTLIFNQDHIKINNEDVDLNGGSFEAEKLAIEEYKVYSAVVFPIFYADEFLGELVIHYVDKKHNAGEDELNLIKMVSGQLAIALHQSNIYEKMRVQNEIQSAILNNIPFMAWLKDKNSVLLAANESFAKNCDVEIKDLIGKTDFEFFPTDHAESYVREDKIVMEIGETISSNDLIVGSDGKALWYETFKSPVRDVMGNIIGTVGLSRDITVIRNAELELQKQQEKIVTQAKREILLRKLIEKMRSSLDIEQVLEFVCEETAIVFDVQRVAITQFDYDNPNKRVKFRKEYKQNPSVLGYYDLKHRDEIANWGYDVFKTRSIYPVDNLQQTALPNFVKDSLTEIGIKSIVAKTISNGENTWGMIVLSEYNHYRDWTEDEQSLLEAISNQIYIAINQSEAYSKQKIMAEREKISRNIIEILRSSLDKTIIKKQFVKNIGKFFDADRVFFSEYDASQNTYLPIDKNSEYLSGPDVKSFVGFDWSTSDIKDHVQPLLEKREIKIPNWDEYVKTELKLSEGKQNLYLDQNVKSSYSFPVLHQTDIIGYFCIDFTHKYDGLSEEDTGRVRSICTQAGIALYQADLYLRSQEAMGIKNEFISKTVMAASNVLNNIVQLSAAMEGQEAYCEKHIENLNHVGENIDYLLKIVDNLKASIQD